MTHSDDLSTLKMVLDELDSGTDMGDHFHIPLKHFDKAVTTLATLIARMEQNSGSISPTGRCCENGWFGEEHECMKQNTREGIAEDASTRKDEGNITGASTGLDTSAAAGKTERHTLEPSDSRILSPAQLGDGRNTAPAAPDVDGLIKTLWRLSAEAPVPGRPKFLAMEDIERIIRAHFAKQEGV